MNFVMYKNLNISKFKRSKLKNQKPFCIWLTGLSGAGKTTIANAIDCFLFNKGKHTYILDGDSLRLGLNANLNFKNSDRQENIRRTAEVAKLMVDAGLIVIVALISPFKKDRDWARSIFEKDNFFEVYLSTPISECEKRDVKNLYKKAREGKLKNFTGIDSPYEPPDNPDVMIDTTHETIDDCIAIIMSKVQKI